MGVETGNPLGDLAARLSRLEDIEAIRTLRMRYHQFVNQGHFPRVSTLYTDDARVDLGPVGQATGPAAIREMYEAIPRHISLVRQFIHNHLVELDGDIAAGLSYLDARYARDGQSLIISASVAEKYRREEAGWKISETIIDVDFAVPLDVGWAGERLDFTGPMN